MDQKKIWIMYSVRGSSFYCLIKIVYNILNVLLWLWGSKWEGKIQRRGGGGKFSTLLMHHGMM